MLSRVGSRGMMVAPLTDESRVSQVPVMRHARRLVIYRMLFALG